MFAFFPCLSSPLLLKLRAFSRLVEEAQKGAESCLTSIDNVRFSFRNTAYNLLRHYVNRQGILISQVLLPFFSIYLIFNLYCWLLLRKSVIFEMDYMDYIAQWRASGRQ